MWTIAVSDGMVIRTLIGNGIGMGAPSLLGMGLRIRVIVEVFPMSACYIALLCYRRVVQDSRYYRL